MNQHRRDLNATRIAELTAETANCISIARAAASIGDKDTARELIARADRCAAESRVYAAANLRA